MSNKLPQGVHFTLSPPKGTESIISTEAIEFLAVLHRTFDARRKELLENRKKVQADLDAVCLSTFLPPLHSMVWD
jgi:malate synthase